MVGMIGANTAFSAVLLRFRNLPGINYYYYARNMPRSIMLRVSWVSDNCIAVCERFRYINHTWNLGCDLESSWSCDSHANSKAELVNNLYNFSKSNQIFLHSYNFTPFLVDRSIFINMKRSTRKSSGKTDYSASMSREQALQSFPCSCSQFKEVEG